MWPKALEPTVTGASHQSVTPVAVHVSGCRQITFGR